MPVALTGGTSSMESVLAADACDPSGDMVGRGFDMRRRMLWWDFANSRIKSSPSRSLYVPCTSFFFPFVSPPSFPARGADTLCDAVDAAHPICAGQRPAGTGRCELQERAHVCGRVTTHLYRNGLPPAQRGRRLPGTVPPPTRPLALALLPRALRLSWACRGFSTSSSLHPPGRNQRCSELYQRKIKICCPTMKRCL